MQGNDISNEYQSTLLVVFEGLLGIPPTGKYAKSWWKRAKSEAETQVAAYGINGLLLAQIRRLEDQPVEVVTFLGPQFVAPIEKRLEELHAVVRNVWYTTPDSLARVHLTHPDVTAIYDPDRMRAFATYGHLGRHLLPGNAALFGTL